MRLKMMAQMAFELVENFKMITFQLPWNLSSFLHPEIQVLTAQFLLQIKTRMELAETNIKGWNQVIWLFNRKISFLSHNDIWKNFNKAMNNRRLKPLLRMIQALNNHLEEGWHACNREISIWNPEITLLFHKKLTR